MTKVKENKQFSLLSCLILGSIAFFISMDIYFPSFPYIKEYFSTTDESVQSTFLYFLIGSFISCFLFPLIIDTYGKKIIFCTSCFLSFFVGVLSLFSSSIEQMIYFRFLQGVFGAIPSVIIFIFIYESLSKIEASKIFSLYGICISISLLLSPFIGGYIQSIFSWRVNAIFSSSLFLISGFLGFVHIKRDPLLKIKNASLNSLFQKIYNYLLLMRNIKFAFYILIIPILYSGKVVYLTSLPFFMSSILKLDSTQYGLSITLSFIPYSIGSYFGGKLSEKLRPSIIIYNGLSICLISSIILFINEQFEVISISNIILSLSLYLFGLGLLYPTVIMCGLKEAGELRPYAISLRTLLSSFLGASGVFYVKQASTQSLSIIFFYISPLIILLILSSLYINKKHLLISKNK